MNDTEVQVLLEENSGFMGLLNTVRNEELMTSLTRLQYDKVLKAFMRVWKQVHGSKVEPPYIVECSKVIEVPVTTKYDAITNSNVAEELKRLDRELYIKTQQVETISGLYDQLRKLTEAKDKTIEKLQNRNDHLVRKVKGIDMVTFNEQNFDV